MNLSLSNFESNINSTILNRGKNYFSEGLVADLEEIDDNYWSALVSGTEVYNVKVKTQNNEIIGSLGNPAGFLSFRHLGNNQRKETRLP